MRIADSAAGLRGFNPQSSGFTLIEVLVVLVLLAVAAGLMVPRMDRSLGHRELREAAERFAQIARTTRELAVARREAFAIEIDLDAGGYGILQMSDPAGGSQGQAVRTSWLKGAQWPETISVAHYRTPNGVTSSFGRQRLVFWPDGTCSGVSVRLARGEAAYDVVIQPHSGRVIVAAAGDRAILPDQYDLGD